MDLLPADISYNVALIPDAAACERLCEVNAKIRGAFCSDGYILDSYFPPHITIFQGGVMSADVDTLRASLAIALSEPLFRWRYRTASAAIADGGYLSAPCPDKKLLAIFDDVSAACASLHRSRPVYRPRVIGRSDDMTADEIRNAEASGNPRSRASFRPHISLASGLEERDVLEATGIASSVLPLEFTVGTIQLLDTGHNNEKWEILGDWHVELRIP